MFKLKKHGKRKVKGKKRDKHSSQSPSYRKIIKGNCMKDYKKHQSTKRGTKIAEHVTHPQIPDFRIEIEKRFSKSLINKIYTFPKKECSVGCEKDEPLDFLEEVTVYDLMAQNEERHKKKRRKQKNFSRKQRNSYRYNLSTSLNQTNTRDSTRAPRKTHKKTLYQKSVDMKEKASHLQRSLEPKKKSSRRTIFKQSKTPRYSAKPRVKHTNTKKNTSTYSSLLGILKQNVKKRSRKKEEAIQNSLKKSQSKKQSLKSKIKQKIKFVNNKNNCVGKNSKKNLIAFVGNQWNSSKNSGKKKIDLQTMGSLQTKTVKEKEYIRILKKSPQHKHIKTSPSRRLYTGNSVRLKTSTRESSRMKTRVNESSRMKQAKSQERRKKKEVQERKQLLKLLRKKLKRLPDSKVRTSTKTPLRTAQQSPIRSSQNTSQLLAQLKKKISKIQSPQKSFFRKMNKKRESSGGSPNEIMRKQKMAFYKKRQMDHQSSRYYSKKLKKSRQSSRSPKQKKQSSTKPLANLLNVKSKYQERENDTSTRKKYIFQKKIDKSQRRLGSSQNLKTKHNVNNVVSFDFSRQKRNSPQQRQQHKENSKHQMSSKNRSIKEQLRRKRNRKKIANKSYFINKNYFSKTKSKRSQYNQSTKRQRAKRDLIFNSLDQSGHNCSILTKNKYSQKRRLI